MSARDIVANTTGVTEQIFVQDATSSTGAGLSVGFGASGLTGEYRRWGQSSWTAIPIVSATLGTFASGGWTTDGGLTGAVEVGHPNAAFASGAKGVTFRYYGVTNMVPVLLRYSIITLDVQSTIPTSAANASAVWQDTNSADFAVPGSAGQAMNRKIWSGTALTTSTTGDVLVDSSIATYVGQLAGCRVRIVAGTGSNSGPRSVSSISFDGSNYHLIPDTAFGSVGTDSVLLIDDFNKNVNAASITPGAMTSQVFDADTLAALFGGLKVTGNTTPITGGQYAAVGIFPANSARVAYKHKTQTMYNWTDESRYYFSSALGATGTNFFQTAPGAPITGPYTLQGAGASGTPIVLIRGSTVVRAYEAGQDPATLVLDVATSAHNTAGTIGAAIGAAGSGSGTGSLTVVVNVKDASTAAVIVGASVKVSGAQAATALTDISGNATLQLNSGTVTVAITAAGYSSYNPTTHTIDGSGHWDGGSSATLNLTMAAVFIPTPPAANQVTCYLYTRDQTGALKPSVPVWFQIIKLPPGENGSAYDKGVLKLTSSSASLVSSSFPIGATVRYWAVKGPEVDFVVPASGPVILADVLGSYAG